MFSPLPSTPNDFSRSRFNASLREFSRVPE
jgi:hypothetical protein